MTVLLMRLMLTDMEGRSHLVEDETKYLPAYAARVGSLYRRIEVAGPVWKGYPPAAKEPWRKEGE